MARAWSIQVLGDYIEQFIVDTRVQVDVDRKFIITSVGKHPEALATLRRIKAIAKDRLLKDGEYRPKAAAALEKQFGFAVGDFVPAGDELNHYLGIHTPMGIILVNKD